MGILKIIMYDISKICNFTNRELTEGRAVIYVLKVREVSVIPKTTGEVLEI